MAGPQYKEKLQTSRIAEDPREGFIRTTNTPSHPNYLQQRWERAGGSGAYPVLTDERPSIDQLPQTAPYFPGGESTGRPLGIDQYWPHTKPGWLEAGITNPNLGGAKVWQAGGVGDWLNYLKRFTPWYDPEQDYRRHEQYQEQNPDLQLEQDKLEADERYRINELQQTPGKHYYGGPGEYYPDKILRDAFPQSYPYLGGLSMTTDSPLNEDEIEQEKIDKWIEDYNIGPEDLGVEPQLEAAIDPSDWRSIVKIIAAGGNPDDYIEKKVNRGGLMSLR